MNISGSSSSISGLLITAECVIVDEPEKEGKASGGMPQMPAGMGGMGGF